MDFVHIMEHYVNEAIRCSLRIEQKILGQIFLLLTDKQQTSPENGNFAWIAMLDVS